MRICLIAHSNSPWAPFYAGHLRDRGHDVHVVSFHPKGIPGVHMHYVGSSRADGRLPKWIYLWRVPRVHRLLRRIEPDVVLATYLRSNALVGALTKCSPLVVSVRGTDYDFRLPFGLDRALVRWIASRAESLHASSDELADNVAEMGVARDRFTVIPLGTCAADFMPRPSTRPPGPPRVICTRKHDRVYDNETIVRGLALLRDEGFAFQCRFVGSGPWLERLIYLTKTLGLSGQIEFLGDVEHREVRGQLVWADIYASAARSDGAPSSLFEAISCKLFPVVTDVRANRDWIRHLEDGYLFRAGSEREFAQGVRTAWGDPGLRERAGERNRQIVIERLDRSTGLGRLEKLLDRAIEVGS